MHEFQINKQNINLAVSRSDYRIWFELKTDPNKPQIGPSTLLIKKTILDHRSILESQAQEKINSLNSLTNHRRRRRSTITLTQVGTADASLGLAALGNGRQQQPASELKNLRYPPPPPNHRPSDDVVNRNHPLCGAISELDHQLVHPW